MIAADVRSGRAALVRSNVARLDHAGDVLTIVSDAEAPAIRPHSVDHVLLDAPCSGLGVLRRRADARWRMTSDAVDRLAGLQSRLLDAVVDLVRPGGTLTYSVCTVTRAESLDQAAAFSLRHPALVPLDPPRGPWRPSGSGAMLLPQDADTDGMSIFGWTVPSVRSST